MTIRPLIGPSSLQYTSPGKKRTQVHTPKIPYGIPRFGADESSRLRRWQLYTELRGKEIHFEDQSQPDLNGMHKRRNTSIKQKCRGGDPEVYLPSEQVKGIVDAATEIILPDGYAGGIKKRPMLNAPYSCPSLSDIEKLAPGMTWKVTIPPGPNSVMKIRQPKINPYLDLSPKSEASKMIKSGLQPSEIAETYQANWSQEKVCRDILQNFSDSHGHTLEGVSFVISRLPNNTYKIRIDGLAQYDYEKAFVLGASDKDGQDEDAGGYGEGLKIIALNLLRDYGAQSVKMASADWAMTYTRSPWSPGTGVLYNKLEHVKKPQDQPKGNMLEIVTDNSKLVEALMKATDYFYHPYNPDFAEATYENDFGGFRVLPPTQNGNLYAAMQRYEYGAKGNWENKIPGLALWQRQKIKLDQSDRDRTHLEQSNLYPVFNGIVNGMSAEDVLSSINALSPYWEDTGQKEPPHILLTNLIKTFRTTHKAKAQFPEKMVANDLDAIAGELLCSREDAKKLLTEKGFTVCSQWFRYIGMKPASEILPFVAPGSIKIALYKDISIKTAYDPILQGFLHKSFFKFNLYSPAQQARFHLIQKGVHLVGEAAQDFQLRIANFQLGTERKYVAPRYSLVPKDLDQPSFEEAIMTAISVVQSEQWPHESAEYSYNATAMTFALAKSLLNDPKFRDRFADLKAVWELSFNSNVEKAFPESEQRPAYNTTVMSRLRKQIIALAPDQFV